jgi:hypothetical protein
MNLSKADQCLQQAKDAADSKTRSQVETEGRLWRAIATEIDGSERKAMVQQQQHQRQQFKKEE